VTVALSSNDDRNHLKIALPLLMQAQRKFTKFSHHAKIRLAVEFENNTE